MEVVWNGAAPQGGSLAPVDDRSASGAGAYFPA